MSMPVGNPEECSVTSWKISVIAEYTHSPARLHRKDQETVDNETGYSDETYMETGDNEPNTETNVRQHKIT